MKRPKDMTREELQALPLASSFEFKTKTDPKTGHTYIERMPMKFRFAGVAGDDLAFWADEFGTWTPEYMGSEIGWAKREMII